RRFQTGQVLLFPLLQRRSPERSLPPPAGGADRRLASMTLAGAVPSSRLFCGVPPRLRSAFHASPEPLCFRAQWTSVAGLRQPEGFPTTDVHWALGERLRS